jgi:hypothetical protein
MHFANVKPNSIARVTEVSEVVFMRDSEATRVQSS